MEGDSPRHPGWERVRHSRWHSAVLSALVSRSRAVPAGGRRSKPSPRFLPGGVGAERCAVTELGGTPSRPAVRGGAGVNTGVPWLVCHPGLEEGAELGWQNVVSWALVSRSRAVPAGGRRSKPSPRFLPGGVGAERCAVTELGGTPSRPAARGGAGVNTGVPWPACHPGLEEGAELAWQSVRRVSFNCSFLTTVDSYHILSPN